MSAPLDTLLARLASGVAAGYARWPARYFGARVYFVVTVDGAVHPRTLQLDRERPRLFVGISAPPDPSKTPFLLFRLTLAELEGLLSSPARAAKLTAEGNEKGLLGALSSCLEPQASSSRDP